MEAATRYLLEEALILCLSKATNRDTFWRNFVTLSCSFVVLVQNVLSLV